MKHNRRTSPEFEMLPIDTAAQRLGFSHWTLRLWIRQGKVSSVKISNRVFVPSVEVERLIAGGMRPALVANAAAN